MMMMRLMMVMTMIVMMMMTMMVMVMVRMKRMVTIARERDANESVFTMDKGCGYVRKPASMTTEVVDGHTDCFEARTHSCEGETAARTVVDLMCAIRHYTLKQYTSGVW